MEYTHLLDCGGSGLRIDVLIPLLITEVQAMPISVECQGCGRKFQAPDKLAGKRAKCPQCSAVIQVGARPPQPSGQVSSEEDWVEAIPVTCGCGKKFRAKAELAGKRVKCPACGQALAISRPGPAASRAPTEAHDLDEAMRPEMAAPAAREPLRRAAPPGKRAEKEGLNVGLIVSVSVGAVMAVLLLIMVLLWPRGDPEQGGVGSANVGERPFDSTSPTEVGKSFSKAMQEPTIAEIKYKLGHAQFEYDEKRSDTPVVKVVLIGGADSATGTRVSDATLVHLKRLTELQELRLEECGQVTNDGLVYLKGLTNLKELHIIGFTGVTDAGLEHLKDLPNLQTLALGGFRFTFAFTDAGLARLKDLPHLQSLTLASNGFTNAGLVHVKNLTSLRSLYLVGSKFDYAALVHLKGMTNLQRLYLIDTRVGGPALAHLKDLTNLHTLYFSGTPITDAGLVHLKGLTQLQTLSLHGTRVTDAGFEDLQKALPRTEIFRPNPQQAQIIAEIEKLGGSVLFDERSPDRPVVEMNLGSADLKLLKGFTNFKRLDLHYTRVTDASLVYLKDLTNLQTLHFTFRLEDFGRPTPLTDAGLVYLKDLTNLQDLDLTASSEITSAGLVHLKGLTNLRWLGLAGTQVDDAGLEHLEGLTKLEFLAIGPRISDAGLVHVKRLTNLQALRLDLTSVTPGGVRDLQKALPSVKILGYDIGRRN